MAWRGGWCASAALLWVLAMPGWNAAFADTPIFESVPTVAPVQESLPTALGLERSTLPASGEQSTLLSIAQFGRYSISVKSAQGIALQLIDRMTGPGAVEGSPGESDGRIDAFLDRGHYKILLHASRHGSGEAALSVRPFAELNGPEIPRFPEIKRIDTDLGDYQQRSYWLEIKERRVVAIEAAGRNLADMRLWRDGNWLVDSAPTATEVEPEAGKPLAVRRIVVTLEPGLYLLSAYGGPDLPWAKTSDAHPLHLRLGIPMIADAGRQAFAASPFGIDRYLVPATANFFRIELPEAEAAELFVRDYDEQQPFEPGGSAAITKQSLPPVAEISGSSRETGFKLVTVRREAGEPYLLQHFRSVSTYHFDGSGDYWIATLHSGYGEDNVDATGLLTKRALGYPERVIDDNAPELNDASVWSRRFNLLEPVTAYFHVTRAGGYVITGSGADAVYRFEPLIHLGVDYKAPEFQPSGYVSKLDPGYYVLTGKPEAEGKGILDIRVAAEGVAGNGGDQAKETSVLFPSEALESSFDYTLYLNQQPGVKAGVVLRRLPIDLQPGLPVVLKAGQTLDIPVTAPRDGRVAAIAEDASPMRFAIDHGAAVTEWRGDGAQHVLTLANTADKALSAALRFTPDSLAPETPLPAVSAEALRAIPNFPPLPLQQPTYFDIAKEERRTFALEVAEPGLYRVESGGLLQTEGAIRTRTVVSLDREANNGTGRNFLLQQYLGQGSYQLSLEAQGETHGHMGVSVVRTVLTDGGALSLGVPARETIAAGNGLAYVFTILTAGRYRLRSLGLGRTYQMRLEDQDGWSIIPPNAPADVTMDFVAGSYRLVILPQPVDARIVTLLERLEGPASFEGHGPHDLPLNQAQSHQWVEPEAGDERVPDQWRFRLPAPAHVKIALSPGMHADLIAETEGATKDVVTGGEIWESELPVGTYQLRATSLEPNNRFDYRVSVAATDLLAGQSRTITLPADIPLSIGSDAVVEIGSFGIVDLRAWLYDAEDRLVATNDDRPNDWNFAIAGRMKPGFYRLHVEAVGAANNETNGVAPGQTTVSIYQAEEQQEPALAVGEDTQLSGPNVHIVPLTAAPGDLLVASADAREPAVGLGIEVKEQGAWRTLSESAGRSPWVAVPVKGLGGDIRLRVWSVDRSIDPIRLQTRMAAQQEAQQDQFLGDGIALHAVPGIEPALGFAAVGVEAPGAYRLAQLLPNLAWSTENGRPLAGDSAGIVFGSRGTFWFGARLAAGAQSVAARRVTLGEDAAALTVPGSDHGTTMIADPVMAEGTPHLWLMESRLGQPGIGGKGLVGATALESAIAVAPDADQAGFALQLWNAGDRASALPATLQRVDFAPPGKEVLGWGVADRALHRRQALLFALPKGLKRLTLALPPQTAVILRDGKTREGVWSGATALALTKDSTAEELLVLPVAEADGPLGLSLTPIARGDAMTVLGGGRIFTQYFPADGVARLNVRLSDGEKKSGAKLRLMLAGEVRQAMLISDDGTVARQNESTLNGNAKVDIAHGAGLVVAWIDGGDPLTSPDVAAKAIRVRETSVVPLSGAAQQIVFAVNAQKFLRLKTTMPVIAQVKPAGGAQQLKVFADGADLGLLLRKGTTPLVLRAVAAGPLAGVAEATLIDIAPIGEGLGPKVRLTPGESRLYSFTVKDERDIGVGVRGSTDTAHCRVLDAVGNEVGAGVVQMLHLKAGTYLLAVDAPAEGTAIEVQPALVGIASPDGSPPDDVKRAYLALAGLKPKQQE
jgi:hypothetical protein